MAVTVVGIGADGWAGLDPERRRAVLEADVIFGAPRQMAMLPDDVDAERVEWPSPLKDGLPELVRDHQKRRVVSLASGDPLVFGVGALLVDALGPASVRVLPAVSSEALARARMGWTSDSVEVLREHRTLARHLVEGRRILVLSKDGDTPAQVADILDRSGFGRSRMTVLEKLGGPGERISEWRSGKPDNLHILAIEVLGGPHLGWVAGLPDDAFDHDGQLTKRDVRAAALARLAPAPGQMLWDIGAGAGSVGIEWMRAHPTCRATAIEARADRAKRIAENAVRLGVGSLRVVTGRAPQALAGLPAPDAIFVGGGASGTGVIDACWDALKPGGRLVVHGVTLQTEQVLAEQYALRGGELTRLHVEHAAPIGSYTGWTPARAVTQWAVTR